MIADILPTLAVVYGQLNQEYRKLMSSIRAVLFLATPHRGTDLAETLNRVLSSSMFGHTSKDYVTELTRNSSTIDELNESFRHHASKLQIFSFYETLSTQVGPMNVKILEKQSSLLGYENETAKPLHADHHDVCKYDSTEDPNYRSVRDALRSVANALRTSATTDGGKEKELEILQAWLGVTGAPDEDLSALRSVRKQGTCEALVDTSAFEEWLRADVPQICWAHAPPGNGKSIQCSFIIDHLKQQSTCVYWFFKYGDVHKHSVANMFRSIAYQIATQDATFRRSLLEQAKSGVQVSKSDASAMWRIVFTPRLSLLSHDLFFIVDALDESESSKIFIDLISNIGLSINKIRVMCFSRPLSNIIQSFQKAKKRVPVVEIDLNDNRKDIRLFAIDEMEEFMASSSFKENTIDEITARAQGNFLWASLVLKRVLQCFRPEDVKRTLRSTPDGMDKLYDRMADAIAKLDQEVDQRLCKILLSWATFSIRPITVSELKAQYSADLGTIIDLKHFISQICGEFVVINPIGQLALVHQTAREYLRTTEKLGFSLQAAETNQELLVACFEALSGLSSAKIQQGKMSPFVSYAATCWHSHLERSSVESEEVMDALVEFMESDCPLSWIHFLALRDQLSVLVAVSSALAAFVRKRRKADAIKPPTLHRLTDLALLETWAVDLLKITAKFGSYLSDDPETIYKCIPPLSPENSVIFQKYAQKPATTISVSGISSVDWDDCLARVPSGTDQALHVAVSNEFLAVGAESSSGNATIRLWSSVIFQERPGFHLDEPICAIAFSATGSFLACYGLDHTFVWKVADCSVVTILESPHRERALALEFGPDESFIVIATDLRRVYRLNLDVENAAWVGYDSALLEEHSLPEGAFINSPSSLAFNEDCKQLAVAYRGFPLAVWSLDPPVMIGRCRRKQKQGQTTSTTWTGVNRIVWHPFNGQVLGIYRDGNIFKWSPSDNMHAEVKQELDATPSEIRCSQNGSVFSTSDVRGSIKIYDYAQMVLIYKLASDDIINSIAFSPDSQRFYDLRGSYCNVWEPNCLLRAVEAIVSEDSESVTSSQRDRRGSVLSDNDKDEEDTRSASLTLYASEAQVENHSAITSVATCAENQSLCAYAKDEGTIEIYDMDRKIRHVIAQSAFGMGVGHIALSRNGDHIAYSLHNGHVHVKSLDLLLSAGKAKSVSVYAEKKAVSRGSIRQLLFSRSSELLLICSSEKLQVLRLKDGSLVAEVTVDISSPPAKWDNHSFESDILLAFTTNDVRSYSWGNLALGHTLTQLYHERVDQIPSSTSTVEFLLPSYHPKMQLVVTSYEEYNTKYFSFLVLNMSALLSERSTDPRICAIDVPKIIADRIDRPVGILGDGRLVFLDKSLWVCTAQVQHGTESRLKRHFFIPPDWLTSAGLLLCRVLADGTLLCPSRGEMAMIESEIGMDW